MKERRTHRRRAYTRAPLAATLLNPERDATSRLSSALPRARFLPLKVLL
jgi:hypothetical protein